MTFILERKIFYHVRKSFRVVTLIFILLFCVIAMLVIKFKPVYAVSISGQQIGYVNNKVEFEQLINKEILAHNGNIAFVTIKQFPEYKLQFVNRNQKTTEDELLNYLKENAEITYRYYAVSFNNENKGFVNTLEEAEQIVADIKAEYSGGYDLAIGITEYYTVNVDDAKKIDENTELRLAKEEIENSVDEYVNRQTRTVNGVYLAQTPITGRITSRFGAYENVRSGAHTGLDIAAPRGTNISAAADGVVTHASPMGSYGNLVIVSHGNGVETYYAHCSKILVRVGQQVNAGDIVGLVGSTGNSTGNHLHFEVRINGKPVNPQKYLYR